MHSLLKPVLHLLKPVLHLLKPVLHLLKPMHLLLKPVLHLLKPLTHPYRVIVIWGDWCTKHRALTYEAALAWAACYPSDALILIRSRRGRLLGLRFSKGSDWS